MYKIIFALLCKFDLSLAMKKLNFFFVIAIDKIFIIILISNFQSLNKPTKNVDCNPYYLLNEHKR